MSRRVAQRSHGKGEQPPVYARECEIMQRRMALEISKDFTALALVGTGDPPTRLQRWRRRAMNARHQLRRCWWALRWLAVAPLDVRRYVAARRYAERGTWMRSCWKCNPAHDHLRNSADLIDCFQCGTVYLYGRVISEGADE